MRRLLDQRPLGNGCGVIPKDKLSLVYLSLHDPLMKRSISAATTAGKGLAEKEVTKFRDTATGDRVWRGLARAIEEIRPRKRRVGQNRLI